MTDNDYKILEFLSTQTRPVTTKDFPVQITVLYLTGLGKNSLSHALMILGQKKLIAFINRHSYSILPAGLEILNDYRGKTKRQENQEEDLRDLRADNPIAQPQTEHMTQTKASLKKETVNKILTNPWVITIIGGLISKLQTSGRQTKGLTWPCFCHL